jgi:nucleoside-diphosphate-sugar epimerase
MPDAINAIQKLMDRDSADIQSRIYNVKSFNPSADEFFNLIKEQNRDAKILYNVNTVRQNIVDSWPCDIDDSLAKNEWRWSPDYNLTRTMNEYLKSSLG